MTFPVPWFHICLLLFAYTFPFKFSFAPHDERDISTFGLRGVQRILGSGVASVGRIEVGLVAGLGVNWMSDRVP